MRRPAARRYIICAFVLVLFAPAALAVASENGLREVLASTNSRLLQAQQTAPGGEPDRSSTEEFFLGVRNRSVHEQPSRSAEVGLPVSAHEPRPTLGPGHQPDYTFREWWNGASQTKKTGTIVGAAVVFLIIVL